MKQSQKQTTIPTSTISAPALSLTCGEVAARVSHRLFAIVERVGLHLVRRAGRQVPHHVLELIVFDRHRLVGGKVVRQAEDLQLERRIVALGRWTPVDDDVLAAARYHGQIGGRVRRCRDRDRPGQPVLVGRVGVVQPEVVARAGQPVRELYLIADVPRSDRCVRCRIADRWVVVEPVKRIIQTLIARDFYDEICTVTLLREMEMVMEGKRGVS